MKYEFDKVIDRHNTGSMKWDGLDTFFGDKAQGALPMWIADMDFAVAPEILSRDMLVMCSLTVALFVIAFAALRGREVIGRVSGAVLLACFVAYTGWLIVG